jgi:hypothetical protein
MPLSGGKNFGNGSKAAIAARSSAAAASPSSISASSRCSRPRLYLAIDHSCGSLAESSTSSAARLAAIASRNVLVRAAPSR